MKPTIEITYCPKCGWLLRSAYFAQEILTTFADELDGLKLKPAEVAGVFIISVDGEEIFNRKTKGRFPETKELKQIIRDKVCPGKSLGHSDKG